MLLTLTVALCANAAPGAPAVARQVHFAFRREQNEWVAGHDTHRVESDARGRVTFFPIGDRDQGPLEPPLTLQVRSVSRGGQRLQVGPRRVRVGARTDQLEVVRDGFVEVLQNRADGVEQSFRFEAAPRGEGALLVDLDTNARWLRQTARGHHFAAGHLVVAYGPATLVTADGARHALETVRTARGLRLIVPASLVEAGPFPAVVDPLVSAELAIDTPVQVPPAGQQDTPAVAFDGTTWLVVWRDFRGGQGSDIYATRVDAMGTVLDPGGLPISVTAGGQYQPAVTFGAGQYYVSFSDTRAGGSDIYGTRVSTAGVALDGTGLSLTNATGLQVNSDVVFNGTDYLVVWEDLRRGGTDSPDIYGTRVTTAGVVLDPTPNLAISAAVWNQYLPRVDADPATGVAFVVWEDTRNLESDIYGSIVNDSGAVGANVAVSRAINAQDKADVAFNGTHFITVWTDRRGTNADVYGARVSPGGVVADMMGVLVAGGQGDQDWPAIAGNSGASQLVVWRDTRASAAADIYATPITGSVTPTQPMGLIVSSAVGAQAEPKLAANALTFLVAFSDTRNGNPDIYGARFSLTGGPGPFTVDPAGIPLAIAANQQSSPAIASDGTSFLAVWQDFRDGGADVFGIRLNPAGAFVDPAPFVVSASPGNESVPAVSFDGVNYVVAWSDLRGASPDIFAARVSPAGNVLDPSGIRVSSGAAAESNPTIASLDGGSLIAWQDSRGGNLDVYATRLSQAGVVLDGTGFPVSTAMGDQSGVKATSYAGDYLLAWTDQRAGNADIYAARVSTAGAVLDLAGLGVSTAATGADQVSLAANSTHALFVWRDTRAGATNPDLYAARFTMGTVIDGSGLPVATTGLEGASAVAWDEVLQRFSIVWDDTSGAAGGDLLGAEVTLAGVVGTASPIGPGRAPNLVFSPAGPGVLAYNRFASGVGENNFRARLRLAGKRGPGAPCVAPSDCLSGSCQALICVAPDGGAGDAGVDGGAPDAGIGLDAGMVADAGVVDAGVPDAGIVADAGEPDAGTDAGAPDAGVDGGAPDAGPEDAGVVDAGLIPDGGAPDAGGTEPDAGMTVPDAGVEPRSLRVGCGCNGVDGSAVLALLLLAATSRRRR